MSTQGGSAIARTPSPATGATLPFLSLLYASGLRRAEAVAMDLADWTRSASCESAVARGRKPRPVSLSASALPALQDWLGVRR